MASLQSDRNIIFISELKHIEMLEPFLEKHPDLRKEGYTLVSFELEIDYALKDRGIPFLSAGAFQSSKSTTLLAEEWTEETFKEDRWKFFNYRGVSLSQLYFIPLFGYLAYVIYAANIVANILTRHRDAKRLVVFGSLRVIPPMGSTLVAPYVNVIADTIVCMGEQKGIEVIVVPMPKAVTAQGSYVWFKFSRALFGIGITILNSAIRLLRRPQRIRALASDYWKSIEPYARHLDSLELILIDRSQAPKAGLANIWKYRIRFWHLDAFSKKVAPQNNNIRELISSQYQALKNDPGFALCTLGEYSLRPLALSALDLIVEEVLQKTLEDIDDAHSLFDRVKPHIVLLRATISNQTHFIILAQVARSRSVPSLEVQHGLEYNGPGSFTPRHSAEYMGVYGPLTQREMAKTNDTRTTPVVIGSPRFDVYAHTVPMEPSVKTEVTFACVAPSIEPVADADAYAYEDYFRAIAHALAQIPNAKVVIKFRPGDNGRNAFARKMLAGLFGDLPYTIVHNEPLRDVYLVADVIISGYSTAAIEAVQCGRPLLYFGLAPFEKLAGLHHFPVYVKEDAMRMATTEAELVAHMKKLMSPEERRGVALRGMKFLQREYAFDGKASERMAALITDLSQGQKPNARVY